MVVKEKTFNKNPLFGEITGYFPRHHYAVGATKANRKLFAGGDRIAWKVLDTETAEENKPKKQNIFKLLEKTSKQISKLQSDLVVEQSKRKTRLIKYENRIKTLKDSTDRIVEVAFELAESGFYPKRKFNPENYHYTRPLRAQTEKQKQASLLNFQKMVESNFAKKEN